MFSAGKSGGVIAPADPYFQDVTLLLTGDGTNGAQNNTFIDSSTNNFTITRNGNTTQGSFSPYGNLWSNYLASSYLTWSGTAIGAGAFTFECWFFYTGSSFPPSGQDGASFIGPSSASGGALGLNIVNSTTVSFDRYGVSADNFTLPTLVANTWYHIAFVRNASNVQTVFLNGTRSSTGTGTSAYNYSGTTSAVGFTGGAVARYFPGYISNARLVIGSAVYDPTQSTLTVPTTPLTAITNTSLLTCQSNRFIDNSSNNFALTVNGTPSVQRFSPFQPTSAYSTSVIGGSGYFDGTGDYLTAPDNAAWDVGSGNFTIESWVYPTASPAQPIIVGQWTSSYSWVMLLSNDGNRYIRGLLYNGSFNDYVSTSSLTLNAWNHCAFVRESNTISLYLNGSRVYTTAYSGTVSTSTSALSIGADASGGSPFPGYLSNTRVVVGTALYSGSTYTVPTAPLTAVTNTSLLLNMTNAGIPDAAMMNDLETVGNAQVSTSVKKYGTGSLYFDGAGDSLIANGVSSSGAYNRLTASGIVNTVEFWLYVNSFTSPRAFLCGSWTASGQYGWTYDVNPSGNIFITTDGAGPTISLSTPITTGNWQHLAFVNDGTNIKIYLNGINVGTQAVLSPTSYIGPLTIGMRSDSSLPLNGYMDDLRITKGYARYTANFTPPTASLPTY